MVVDAAAALHRPLPYALPWCVALGGLIVGAWQAAVLRPRVSGAAWWVIGCIAGWALAAASTGAADGMRGSGSLRGVAGLALYLGALAIGGLLLGAAQGAVLHRLSAAPRDAPPTERTPR